MTTISTIARFACGHDVETEPVHPTTTTTVAAADGGGGGGGGGGGDDIPSGIVPPPNSPIPGRVIPVGPYNRLQPCRECHLRLMWRSISLIRRRMWVQLRDLQDREEAAQQVWSIISAEASNDPVLVERHQRRSAARQNRMREVLDNGRIQRTRILSIWLATWGPFTPEEEQRWATWAEEPLPPIFS